MAATMGHKEVFARFFEAPSREALRELLKQHVGETKLLDFKETWPKYPALAKHILALSNTGNGCIVAGMKETDDKTLEPIGVAQITDKVDIINGIKSFVPNDVLSRVSIQDFAFDDSEYSKIIGKRFQVLFVEFSVEHTPALSVRAGDGVRAATIYVRREGQTDEATYDEVQAILNRRIETMYSTSDETSLKQHLEQLKILYAEFPLTVSISSSIFGALAGAGSLFHTNSNAPTESYEEFVSKMIALKKNIIARSIGAGPEMSSAQRVADEYRRAPKAKTISRNLSP